MEYSRGMSCQGVVVPSGIGKNDGSCGDRNHAPDGIGDAWLRECVKTGKEEKKKKKKMGEKM